MVAKLQGEKVRIVGANLKEGGEDFHRKQSENRRK